MSESKLIQRSLKARYDYLRSVRVLDDHENDIFTERRAELIGYIKKSVDTRSYQVD